MVLKMFFGFQLGFVTLLFAVFISSIKLTVGEHECIESEKQALLSFKKGLNDPKGMLSSWRNDSVEDCCNWRGVECSNLTGHVIELDLGGFAPEYLSGIIGPSLLQLSHLNYLDLSNNHFSGFPIPNYIGSLVNLIYLDLSYNRFTGIVPPHLGNLSSLETLYLKDSVRSSESLEWLSRLSSLRHLDLHFMNLENVSDWMQVINNLPHLQTFIICCGLQSLTLPSYDSYINISTSLSELDISGNNLTSSIFLWLSNFSTSLVRLDLSFNNIQGYIPNNAFKNMISLSYIDFGHNLLEGASPNSFRNSCNLHSLVFQENKLKGMVSDFFQMLSKCAQNSLQNLHFSNNNFSGPLLDFSTFLNLKLLDLSHNEIFGKFPVILGQLSKLETLDFSNNKFCGPLPDFSKFQNLTLLDLSSNNFSDKIPVSLGQLSNLETLLLNTNSLEGIVFEAHFSNLAKLRSIDFSHNFLSFHMNSDWVPPFQLKFITLSSCKLGPKFPQWLRGQNFVNLDLSNTSISDTIPYWFWNYFSLSFPSVDLSDNKIRGELPTLSPKSEGYEVNLRSNEFHGEVPKFLLSQNEKLDVSNNKFSGLNYLCEVNDTSPLYFLDASNNQFLGELPNCWWNMSNLLVLNLANNDFSGRIPSSLSNLSRLRTMDLSNNNFSGKFPSWLKNFNDLLALNLQGNSFTRAIPSWIGNKLMKLLRLSLRSNQLDGELPSSICHLNHILFLDISSNNITGEIPSCLHNLTALTMLDDNNDQGDIYIAEYKRLRPLEVVHDEMLLTWKGRDAIMKKALPLLRSIDLSGNRLTGKIPNGITDLIYLVSLNLSKNNLIGGIPENIGKLESLDFLDLSRNELAGQIPQSLSQIHRLSVLDLSFNRLTGKIPISTQLQSFNASAYMGNTGLCGFPLSKCFEDEMVPSSTNMTKEAASENEFATQGFYFSVAIGFIVGFWGICGTLMFYRSWRHAYFRFLDDLKDWFYVKIAVFTNKLHKLFTS